MTTTDSTISLSTMLFKKGLIIALAATALTLSACNKEDDSTLVGSAQQFDSQTSEAEAAAEIANADPMDSTIESAILPSADMPEGTGEVSGSGSGAVAGEVATAGFGMKEGMYTDDNTVGAEIDNDSEVDNPINENDVEVQP